MQSSRHRSMLILPVNVQRFVEKAHLRGADAIVLDLEDAIPSTEKQTARELVRDSLEIAGRGGADVIVRVNNDPDLLEADLAASMSKGLHGVFFPKVESARQVRELVGHIDRLEKERGLTAGAIRIDVHVENPKGILNIREIVEASPRVESASIGVDDYCLEMGIEPTREADELFVPFSMLAIACRAAGVSPMGVLGTVAEYRDLEAFESSARKARRLGADGAYCIHPGQVAVLNRVFAPTPQEVEHAQQVVEVFEQALKQGRASTSLDGRMIDTPVYTRAQRTLQRAGETAD